MKNENLAEADLFRRIFSRSFVSVMVGSLIFGIMDNGIMVLAGTSIDNFISSFGFSTMLSAGLGNTLSDAVGVLSGSMVARWVYLRWGEVNRDDIGANVFLFGETFGIVLGCLIGLLPLAFL